MQILLAEIVYQLKKVCTIFSSQKYSNFHPMWHNYFLFCSSTGAQEKKTSIYQKRGNYYRNFSLGKQKSKKKWISIHSSYLKEQVKICNDVVKICHNKKGVITSKDLTNFFFVNLMISQMKINFFFDNLPLNQKLMY